MISLHLSRIFCSLSSLIFLGNFSSSPVALGWKHRTPVTSWRKTYLSISHLQLHHNQWLTFLYGFWGINFWFLCLYSKYFTILLHIIKWKHTVLTLSVECSSLGCTIADVQSGHFYLFLCFTVTPPPYSMCRIHAVWLLFPCHPSKCKAWLGPLTSPVASPSGSISGHPSMARHHQDLW